MRIAPRPLASMLVLVALTLGVSPAFAEMGGALRAFLQR
jgi:hypothetical protein